MISCFGLRGGRGGEKSFRRRRWRSRDPEKKKKKARRRKLRQGNLRKRGKRETARVSLRASAEEEGKKGHVLIWKTTDSFNSSGSVPRKRRKEGASARRSTSRFLFSGKKKGSGREDGLGLMPRDSAKGGREREKKRRKPPSSPRSLRTRFQHLHRKGKGKRARLSKNPCSTLTQGRSLRRRGKKKKKVFVFDYVRFEP